MVGALSESPARHPHWRNGAPSLAPQRNQWVHARGASRLDLPGQQLVSHPERDPHAIGTGQGERPLEPRRRDANHGEGQAIERDRPADRAGIRPEPGGPQAVTEDGDRDFCVYVFVGEKGASERRLDRVDFPPSPRPFAANDGRENQPAQGPGRVPNACVSRRGPCPRARQPSGSPQCTKVHESFPGCYRRPSASFPRAEAPRCGYHAPHRAPRGAGSSRRVFVVQQWRSR